MEKDSSPAEESASDKVHVAAVTAKIAKMPVFEETKGVIDSKPGPMSDFIVREKVGYGAFGSVYKCFKKLDPKREYAMKVLKKAHLRKTNHLKYACTERDVLARMARHKGHPFIVKMHQSFQTAEHLHLVLDYLPNGDLAHHLEQVGFFREEEA